MKFLNRSKVFYYCLFLVFGIVACESGDEPNPIEGEIDPTEALQNLENLPQSFAQSSNEFAFRLFDQLQKSEELKEENAFISPLSIQLALGMLLNGADNATSEEIKQTLALQDFEIDEINDNYQSLIKSLPNVDPNVEMSIGNSLWYDQQFEVKNDFISTIENFFSAEVSQLNFQNESDSRTQINGWVNNQTNGKISKIIDQISPSEVMFLINAIYFQGDWKYQFDKDLTEKDTFFLNSSESVEVDMMVQEQNLNTATYNDFVAFELPYANDIYKMTVVLPPDSNAAQEALSPITADFWEVTNALMSEQEVELHLPKFEMSYEVQIQEILQEMGMSSVFSSQADLSKISDTPIEVSQIKHKSFIKVEEEGTEAAAVTSIGFQVTSAIPSGPRKIICNRPFYFVISEVVSNQILFIGEIANPNLE